MLSHLKTKRCSACGQPLPSGMAFETNDGQFFCRSCFLMRQDKLIETLKKRGEADQAQITPHRERVQAPYRPISDPISFENAIPLFPFDYDSSLHSVMIRWLWVDANGHLFTAVNTFGCFDSMEFFYRDMDAAAHEPGRENAQPASYHFLHGMIQKGLSCAGLFSGFDEAVIRSYQGMTLQNWKAFARPYPSY